MNAEIGVRSQLFEADADGVIGSDVLAGADRSAHCAGACGLSPQPQKGASAPFSNLLHACYICELPDRLFQS